MPLVKGTNRIKGVLDIGARQQISKNQSVFLSDSEYFDHRAQTAMQMGLICCEEMSNSTYSSPKVTIKNIHGKEINIGDSKQPLMANRITILSEEEFRSSYIQAALKSGMIEVVSASPGTSVSTITQETEIKVGDIFSDLDSPSYDEESTIETNDEILETPDVVEPTRSNVIDTENPEPVSKSAIEDPKKNSVVWNPANNPVIQEMKNTTPSTSDKDGIIFVDKTQEQERIDKHPKLSGKDLEQNGEIDFV